MDQCDCPKPDEGEGADASDRTEAPKDRDGWDSARLTETR